MKKYIFALGFFDGVHLGHQALLTACRTLAAENGAKPGVVTFGSHPDALVLGASPRLINTAADRERLLRENYAMEQVVTLPFDQQMRTMPWQDFLAMLRREYGAVGFVCGEDFRFGNRGAGSAALLEDYCAAEELACAVVPELTMDDVRISSTYIREKIEAGQMATAVRFLGHPHILSGRVIPGRQLGRSIGVPTANILLPPELAAPKFGVYACLCRVQGQTCAAVTNIGTRPTVSGAGVTVESWLLDYTGDLYGQEIVLEMIRFLRPEQKFSALEELKQAIHRDAEAARTLL